MDLMIAVEQLAAVINVGQPHRAAAGEGDRRSRRSAAAARVVADALVGAVAINATVPEVNPVASGDAIPEVQQPLIVTGIVPALQLRQFRIRQYPDADAISIRDAVLFAI